MRFISMFALLAATTALGGCPAGDGAAARLAASGPVCGVNAGPCTYADPVAATTPTTTTPVLPSAPPPNIGNDVKLSAGDATIALEKSVLVSQKTDPAYSILTTSSANNTAKFQIDPKSPNSALWPVAKTMTEYVIGSCDSLYGQANYDTCLDGGGGGTGLGGTYKEYRAFSANSAGVAIDEELQVWNWNYSYGTQYRDITSAGDATHQAWSFGGTKTIAAAMPVSGTADYYGQFGATAKTSNWIDSKDIYQTITYDNIWSVIGVSELHADFALGNFTGKLTPQIWNADATKNNGAGFTDVDLTLPTTAPVGSSQQYIDFIATNNANKAPFMNTKVLLKGTFQDTVTKLNGNSITGTAVADPKSGFETNEPLNPMYAGFYGPNANEVTGVFNFEAALPAPIGGKRPINDDRRAFIEMSGVFNGQ
jgi:C-lobe and N-lobe beta barrels of Tf-binding protein B